MDKYYCTTCGSSFDEPFDTIDYVTFDPYPMGYDITVCPHCGSEDYIVNKKCSCCHNQIVSDYYEDACGNYYCKLCINCKSLNDV